MDCPDCQTPTKTRDTRRSPGYIRRRRYCPACGLRFTTEETLRPESLEPAQLTLGFRIQAPYTREQVWAKTGGLCGLCGLPVGDDWDVDHILPTSLGGPNTLSNVQPSHPRCNGRKGNRA